MTKVCEQIRELLASSERIILLSHHNPDGDTLGSMLALWHHLSPGRKVRMACSDPVPELYRFLPGWEEVLTNEEALAKKETYDLAVAVDASDLGRLGPGGGELIARAQVVVSIDHHATGEPFGNPAWIDPDAAATGELVWALLRDCLTEEIATALYTAIITDCGSFRYANTTAQTLTIAGKLVEAGADPHLIATRVFETRSFASLKLLERALGTLEVDGTGQLGWMELTEEMFQATGATQEAGEGFVNYVRMIEGVRLAILFRENSGKVRVSLRSLDVDVGKLAATFGGGGHVRAAGCELAMPLADAKEQVLARAREFLEGKKIR
ncbi:MAG: bifunctional oligoribonuclease/PAP phosphatase NrnA [Firmicutes bacterium]|nr:bifunctional oligoribonuclease/PAP phosphatase NrnA [Bacillota bacterium]